MSRSGIELGTYISFKCNGIYIQEGVVTPKFKFQTDLIAKLKCL